MSCPVITSLCLIRCGRRGVCLHCPTAAVRWPEGQCTGESAPRVEPYRVTHVRADQLSQHLDATYRDYLVRGLHEGFRIGFQYRRRSCRSTSANMPMAMKHPEVVGEYLRAELRARRVLGPVDPEVASLVEVNRFGLVPKAHQPDKWRLIVDLSFPRGNSVNDGSSPRSAACITRQWMKLAGEWWHMAGEPSWPNLM